MRRIRATIPMPAEKVHFPDGSTRMVVPVGLYRHREGWTYPRFDIKGYRVERLVGDAFAAYEIEA